MLFTNEVSKAAVFESKWSNREKAQTADPINRKKKSITEFPLTPGESLMSVPFRTPF